MLFAFSSVVVGSQSSNAQIDTICERLIPNRVHAIVVGELGEGNRYVADAPAYIASYYQIPLLTTVGQAEEVVTESDAYDTLLRLLPHISLEVEAWCALLSHLQLTHAVMISPNDAVGTQYEIRMRHCWWRRNVIRFVQFAHWEAHAKRPEIAQLVQSLKQDDYKIVLMYAEKEEAEILFEEAAELGITGPGWLWIVSQYAAKAANLPVGAIVTSLIKPNELELIDEAVTLIAYTSVVMYNDVPRVNRSEPPDLCDFVDNYPRWMATGRQFFRFVILVDNLFNVRTRT